MISRKIFYLAAASLVLAYSCNEAASDDANNADSMMNNMEEAVSNAADNMVPNDDERFVNNAVEDNAAELHYLMLGKDKGGSAVKDAASQMEADHKKMGEDVMAYAAKKNISINADTDHENEDLNNGNAGRDWDKAWADKMVSDHEKAISLFEDGEQNVDDPELKSMITATLPTLRRHLEMAKDLQSKLK